MKATVSVIIPVYNSKKHLDRCISSVVQQTYKNIEVVLVDDDSTDGSLDICNAWAQKDARIKVVHKENAGAGKARNTGMDNASGDYYCFVDSDDYIDPSTIQICIDSMEKYKADTSVFGHSFVSEKGEINPQIISAKKQIFNHTEVVSELLPSFFTLSMGFTVSVWGKIFSAKIIRDNSLRFLNEREIYSEDTLFLLEYFPKCERAVVVNRYMYNYYENETSLSRVYEKEKEEKLNIFLHKALEIAKTNGLDDNMARHIKARYQSCAMVEYKQIVLSKMRFSDKLQAIKEKSESDESLSSLKDDVICLHGFAMRLFYTCLKKKMYRISYLLIWIRLHK